MSEKVSKVTPMVKATTCWSYHLVSHSDLLLQPSILCHSTHLGLLHPFMSHYLSCSLSRHLFCSYASLHLHPLLIFCFSSQSWKVYADVRLYATLDYFDYTEIFGALKCLKAFDPVEDRRRTFTRLSINQGEQNVSWFHSLERRKAMILHSAFMIQVQLCRRGWMEIRGHFRITLAIWVIGEVTVRGFDGADRSQRRLEPWLSHRVGLVWEIIQFEWRWRAGLSQDGGGDASKLWGASVVVVRRWWDGQWYRDEMGSLRGDGSILRRRGYVFRGESLV